MKETLIAYSEKRANSNDVLRALMTHRNWFVPLSFFVLSGEEKRRADSLLILGPEKLVPAGELWIFTDEESARLANDKGASLGAYAGGMSGTELFQIIEPGFQTVYVNPGSPLRQCEESQPSFDAESARDSGRQHKAWGERSGTPG